MKKVKRTSVFLLVFVVAFAMLVTGCGNGGPAAPVDPDWPAGWPTSVTITAGPMGGPWFPHMIIVSETLAREIPQVSWTVIEGGGLGNIRRLQDGTDAQIGMAHIPVLGKAMDGTLEMEGWDLVVDNVRMGPSTSTSYVVAFTRDDNTAIQSWADIRGSRFAPGLATSGQIPLIIDILSMYDLSWEEIHRSGGRVEFVSYSEMVSLMQDRNLDVGIVSGDMPNAALMEMQASFPVRLIEFEDHILDEMLLRFPYMIVRELSPERSQIATHTVPMQCIVLNGTIAFSGVLPDDFVYEVIRVIMEHSDEIRAQHHGIINLSWDDAVSGGGIEDRWMHPSFRQVMQSGPQ